MLKTIEDTLHKTCLIGLSYFNAQGEQLKQNILSGRVVSVDKEMGITIQLATGSETSDTVTSDKAVNNKSKEAHFILPTNLSCWFTAPKGEFHTSQKNVKIINPDYLVTWDIYQLKNKQSEAPHNKNQSAASIKIANIEDSEQQWWQWRPRAQVPNVG